jgi:hypothetical protein
MKIVSDEKSGKNNEECSFELHGRF